MDGGSIVVGLRFDGSNLVSRRWQVRPTQNERKWKEVWILNCTRLKRIETESLYPMNDIDKVAQLRSTAERVCGCVGADIRG